MGNIELRWLCKPILEIDGIGIPSPQATRMFVLQYRETHYEGEELPNEWRDVPTEQQE